MVEARKVPPFRQVFVFFFARPFFPVCNGESGEWLSPCPFTCKAIDAMLNSLTAFLRTESIPVLNLLKEARMACVLTSSSGKRCLLALQEVSGIGVGYAIVNASLRAGKIRSPSRHLRPKNIFGDQIMGRGGQFGD